MKPVKKGELVPLKFIAFDIECVPLKSGNVPDPKKDPIVLISIVFSDMHEGKKSIVLSTRPGKNVTAFESEKEMLEEFMNIVVNYDPDIIIGYNINNFDIPYILERMSRNGIKPVFGRCKQKPVTTKKLTVKHNTSITGRIVVDVYEIIKKDFSLMRYNLDYVAEKLLGEKKISVKPSEIEKLWKGTDSDFERLVTYCLKDSVLAMNLVFKLELLDKYIALSALSGTLLQDTLSGGETMRIENFLLREFNKEGYILPCKPDNEEVAKRDSVRKTELKGGFVLEPVKGLHSNIIVLDFKSMYPSIIRTFNICPTTLIRDNEVENPIVTASGAKFVPKDVREGVIPKILERLVTMRQKVKKLYKKESEPGKRRALFSEQWALKILANAFYGYLGYSRARIYDLDIANAITASGRSVIQKTKMIIEKEYGYIVVYGDTDSVMVKVPVDDLEEIKKIGDKISKEITERLPGVLELEFEKVFKRFLPLTKKRYVAWKFEPVGDNEWKEGIEMKGIETVRRDWCELVGDTIRGVIEIILKKNDIREAVKYFRNVVDRLVKGEIDIQKLVITKTMTKIPKNYAGMQPHIELVKKIQARNPAETPGIGDRIGYVIIKGIGLLSKRAEDPNYVIENGLQIDSRYYIDNQLLPPLERIFNAINISKSELLGNGKQIGILEAITKSENNEQEKILKQISLKEVNGFVCRKCGKFYSRPPLVGTCECGGLFLFSSSHGPAESVLI